MTGPWSGGTSLSLQSAIRRLRADVKANLRHRSRPPAPKWVGPFQIRELLGSGANADVYRAFEPASKKSCALKVIVPVSQAQRERFVREGEIARRLSHENIARVLATGATGEHAFIAYELIEGVPLSRLIAGGGTVDSNLPVDAWLERCFNGIAVGLKGKASRLPAPLVLHIGKRLALALAHAHQHGVIHRDIKPANVMVSDGGAVTLLDFGCARDFNHDPEFTAAGIFIGTQDYAAPEQLVGDRDAVTAAADVFGWGATMYELLTEQLPWPRAADRPIGAQWRSARDLNPLTPLRLDGIVMRSIAALPKQRFTDGSALVRALTRGGSRRVEVLSTTTAQERSVSLSPRVEVFLIAISIAAFFALPLAIVIAKLLYR